VLSGGEGGSVKLWDIREAGRGGRGVWKVTEAWVSQVKWGKETSFATCGYDGMVKVWDIRCAYPMATLKGVGK